MQPTAQAVGKSQKNNQPQRGERVPLTLTAARRTPTGREAQEANATD